jgi:hypothetical protein
LSRLRRNEPAARIDIFSQQPLNWLAAVSGWPPRPRCVN